MPFEVLLEGTGKDQIITLRDIGSGTKAEVFAFGALLNVFSVLKRGSELNVIDGFNTVADAKENITNGFKSAKLSPFVCRLLNGEYFHGEQLHRINKFYLDKEAIHGLIYDASFSVIESGKDEAHCFVRLQYEYQKNDEGFPYPFVIEITYMLQENNYLSVDTKVMNTSNADMPLADGWHPYFRLDKKVDELYLQINCRELVEFDDRLLPTGNFSSFTDFNSSALLRETFFDNCFVLNENNKPACVLRDASGGVQVNILPDTSYPYLQIYTPPHRESIAIENLSSIPDAFNNGIGLIILKPGGSYYFKTAYQIILS